MTPLEARLLPWLDALHQHAELPPRPTLQLVDEARRSRVVWLRWKKLTPPDHDCVVGFLYAFEALELLALLARVDYAAWLRTIVRVWPGAAARWSAALYPTEFQLGVAVHVSRGGQLSKWAERAFLPDLDFVDVHEDYDAVRYELEGALPQDAPPVDVAVCFVLEDMGQDGDAPTRLDNFSLLLFEAVQLAMTQVARSAGVALSRRRSVALFQFAELHVNTTATRFFDLDVLYFGELSAYGVRVPEPRLSSLILEPAETALFGIESLQRMLATTQVHHCAPTEKVTVKLEATRQTVDASFSAILASQSLRELVVAPEDLTDATEADADEDRTDHARLMKWLAVSVFGPFGCPTLEKLTLNMSQLGSNDIAVLERTLSQADPFSSLFLGGVRDVSGVGYTFASASTFRLTHPAYQDPTGTEPIAVSFDDPIERLWVFSCDDQWVSVLLPGWGQAWVPHSDVTLKPLLGEEAAVSKAPNSIHHLVMESDEEQIVLELLQVVGIGVKVLTIKWDKNHEPLSESWLPAVCRACPDLEELYVEGVDVQSLEALVGCYEDGACHVTRLVLDIIDVESDATDLKKLMKALAIPNHAVALHLRELSIKIRMPWRSHHLLSFNAAVVHMLKLNKVLWSFDLVVCFDGRSLDWPGTVTRLPKYDAIFDHFNRKKIAFRAAPLHLDRKLAFLSVLRGESPIHALVRCGMDAAMVGTIFEFAAECKERRVQVNFE